jgi:DNA polymerase-3 subunit delta
MTYEDLISEIDKKNLKPVYLLQGDESYYIDLLTEYFCDHVLTPDEKSFNFTTFYGKDSDVRNIIMAARRFPMMAKYQLIIVREAQDLKDIDQLEVYVEKPLASTILVLAYKYGKLDKRKKISKSIENKGVVFESVKLRDNKVADWIMAYVKKKGKAIEPNAASLLAEFLGSDLAKIVNEVDKLFILLPSDAKSINTSQIEKNIGFSKEFNAFELCNAISQRNILKANRIVMQMGHMPDSKVNYPGVMKIIFNFFAKIMIYHSLKDKSPQTVASELGVNPYFVKDYEAAAKKYTSGKVAAAISYLREYDLKMKGIGNISASSSELMEELIFKIMH